jgi:hypothetical protein
MYDERQVGSMRQRFCCETEETHCELYKIQELDLCLSCLPGLFKSYPE